MKRFFKWLWYAARESQIEPLWVDFPAGPGPLRFVFLNVEKAPQVIVWCWDMSTVSSGPNQENPNEVLLILDKPVKAMGVVGVSPEALMEVFSGERALTLMPVAAAAFDVSRTYTHYVPRWRVFLKWLYCKDEDEYREKDEYA